MENLSGWAASAAKKLDYEKKALTTGIKAMLSQWETQLG